MASQTFYIKQGDTAGALGGAAGLTLLDADGNAVDVTGATVVFSMSKVGGGVKVREQSATVVTAASGLVAYSWASGDTDDAGEFIGEFEVTYADSSVQTFPNKKANTLRIIIEEQIA